MLKYAMRAMSIKTLLISAVGAGLLLSSCAGGEEEAATDVCPKIAGRYEVKTEILDSTCGGLPSGKVIVTEEDIGQSECRAHIRWLTLAYPHEPELEPLKDTLREYFRTDEYGTVEYDYLPEKEWIQENLNTRKSEEWNLFMDDSGYLAVTDFGQKLYGEFITRYEMTYTITEHSPFTKSVFRDSCRIIGKRTGSRI